MESTARSTAPAADNSLLSLAIREEGKKLAQEIPASSRAPQFKCMHCPRTFKTARGRGGHVKAHKDLRPINHRLARAGPETVPEFKCMHCPRTFKTAQARGGHVKVHKHLRLIHQLQKQKEHRRPAPSGPQLFKSHLSAGSGVVPFFAGTGTGGLAPSSAANGYVGHVGGRQIGSPGHLGSLREVTQGEAAHGIHNFPSLGSKAVPLFLLQTGGSTSSLPQPLFAAPAPVVEGNGGTGDGVHLGGQQGMPAANPEETTDGIDLTLRL